MKRLFQEEPRDLIEWLLEGAVFVAELSAELDGEPVYADFLYDTLLNGERCLLHIEFQRNRDSKMAERLWTYNMRATLKYECSVWSVVIYLKKDSTMAQSFLTRALPNGRRVHQFDFDVIKLWDIPTQELKAKGLKGLLPLLVLTREGARREVVEEVIEELAPSDQESNGELLALIYGFASLVFESETDQEWLVWRFSMLDDILSETRAFQEIERKGLEKGMKRGMEQGMEQGMKEGGLQTQRQTLCDIIWERFPDLLHLAKEQVEATSDAELLRRVTVKVSVAPTMKEVEQFLLAITPDDKRN